MIPHGKGGARGVGAAKSGANAQAHLAIKEIDLLSGLDVRGRGKASLKVTQRTVSLANLSLSVDSYREL